MRYLHYVDSAVKVPIRSGLEDLPEKSTFVLLICSALSHANRLPTQLK